MKKEITKEYLEDRWWHRLATVLIYLTSVCISVFVFVKISYEIYGVIAGIMLIIFSFVIAYILFFLLSLIYYEIILYIIYGKNKNIFPYSSKSLFVALCFFIVTVIILMSFSLMNENNEYPIDEYDDSLIDLDLGDLDLDLDSDLDLAPDFPDLPDFPPLPKLPELPKIPQ
jgi:hypothetical protein